MINHGIHNSKADVWVHLSPLNYRLYWYLRRHMIDYLKNSKITASIGRSKDRTETGLGITVQTSLPFIKEIIVPDRFIDHFGSWEPSVMNDRDAGVHAETIADWLISLGYLPMYPYRLDPIRQRAEQLKNFGDFDLSFAPRARIEVKADRLIAKTGNLYVQIGERGHRPCLLQTDSGSVEHITPIPALKP